jgi:hypothetical protein
MPWSPVPQKQSRVRRVCLHMHNTPKITESCKSEATGAGATARWGVPELRIAA